jgi:GxxExxY protein
VFGGHRGRFIPQIRLKANGCAVSSAHQEGPHRRPPVWVRGGRWADLWHHWRGDGRAPDAGAWILEAVYQDALEVQFSKQAIPFQREVPFAVEFEGVVLKARYRADFVCFGQVLVELKAHAAPLDADSAQVINYLKASGLQTGLLLNFGGQSLHFRRFIWSRRPTQSAK